MRRRSALVPLAGLFALAGCEGAVAPERAAAYDFDLFGTGLVFHWTPDRLPVRYWVAPDAGPVREFAVEGIRRWSDQFLYGEFRGTLVDDSTVADVLVRVSPPSPPGGRPTDDPPVVDACEGVTQDSIPATPPYRLLDRISVRISWDERYADTDVINCLERVTAHEIGHTLGLFGHSPNDLDLMHGAPRVSAPSAGDRATAEVLYHTPATILPPEVPR